MASPPKDVPDGLNGRQYAILTIQYLLMQWLPQATAAQAKAMNCSASDFRGTPFEDFSKDHMNKLKVLSSLVHGTFTAGQNVTSAAESVSKEIRAGLSNAGAALDQVVGEHQQLKDAKKKIGAVWDFTGQQFGSLVGKALENVQKPLPARDVPEGLSATEYFDLGVHYKDIGWTEQSRDALTKARELDRQGQIGREAERFMRTRLPRQSVPHAAVTRNIQGYNLMQANRTEEARQHFEKLIAEYPAFEWPYSNLGRLYVGLGDTHKANQLLWQALDINPDYANAWCNLALSKIVDSEFDEAGKYLQKATAVDPQNPACEHLNKMLEYINQFRR